MIDNNKTADTTRILSMCKLSIEYKGTSPAKAIAYLKRANELSRKIKYLHGEALSLYDMGTLNYEMGNTKAALEFWFQSIPIYKEMTNSDINYVKRMGFVGISNNLTWIARLYCDIGEMENFEKHHSEIKQLMDKYPVEFSKMAWISIEWAGCYFANERYDEAMKQFEKAYEYFSKANDQYGKANTLANMGMVHFEIGNIDSAFFYLRQSLALYSKVNSSEGKSWVHNILGNVFKKEKLTDSAELHYSSAYEEAVASNNYMNKISSCINMARLFTDAMMESKALPFWKKAYDLSVTHRVPSFMMTAGLHLARYNESKNNFKEALEYYKSYLSVKDSIDNSENMKAIGEMESKYQFDKEQSLQKNKFEKDLKTQEAIAESQKQKQKLIILFVSIGLLIVIVFSIFLYKRVLITRKQNRVIEKQKAIVELKNKEILDSINYAKRIQAAVLPSEKMVKSFLPESFIFYKPKDIVAGDFYWLEVKNDKVLVAAADCTGHGVPGAMVSVICNNGLNRSVREHNITDPGKILNKTREIVVQEFEKSDEKVNDGMDIALISMPVKIENGKNKLEFAGANNPVWIIRKDSSFLELKGDKQHVGKYEIPVPYQTHSCEIEKGDTIYIFTDGYKDQFGGAKNDSVSGKKFKASRMRELLVSIHKSPVAEQFKMMESTFEKWRGDLEQIDDICVIGIKI